MAVVKLQPLVCVVQLCDGDGIADSECDCDGNVSCG